MLSDDGTLLGLQLELADQSGDESLYLNQIGGTGTRVNTIDFTSLNGQLEMINILYDTDVVCDVELVVDGISHNLSKDTSGHCDFLSPEIQVSELLFEDDHPLVGLHGRTHMDQLLDLGIIWHDRLN